MKTGVLLVNTGSPDSPELPDVQKYLREFLMDERVVDIPAWKRKLLVYGIIVPFRSKKVSRLYRGIWTPGGSPLVAITRDLARKLAASTGLPVLYAMRYGNPSIKSALESLAAKKLQKIILVPMFPHYAMSTYESVVEKVRQEMKSFAGLQLEVIPPFYNNPDFIKSLYDNATSYLKKKFDPGKYDHIIFSYHSLPIRHIQKADKTQKTCLVQKNCCEIDSPVHETCYRAQVLQTTKLFMKKAGIKTPPGSKKTSLTFQSAMRGRWLGPSTEEKIIELANNGSKKILVICPGFVADNLETLDEIGIRGKESFLLNAGLASDESFGEAIAKSFGEPPARARKKSQKKSNGKPDNKPEFTFIPSLNLNETWVKTLTKWIKNAV